MLPAAIPNLVVNGAAGIAVGMATNMAPHNLVEVVQALRYLVTHPRAGLDDLMRFIPGPDLPTGGKIIGLDGIRDAYETGRGVVPDAGDRTGGERDPAPQGHRGHRAAVRRRPRAGHRADQEPGAGQEAAGHLRREGPHRPREGAAAGHRGEERVRPRGGPRAALQADPPRGVVRHQRGRPRRGPAPHARAEGDARGVPGAPLRRRTAPLGVPAREGEPTGCTSSRVCCSRSSTSTR